MDLAAEADDNTLKTSAMARYVIRESKLRSAIKRVVAEEINNALKEGRFGNFMGKVGKGVAMGAAKTAVMPLWVPNDLTQKVIKNFVIGNPNLNWSDSYAAKSRIEKMSGAEIKREFGVPETKNGMGKELTDKRPMVLEKFLGGEEDANFGAHHFEEYQESNKNSVWHQKLNSIMKNYNENLTPEEKGNPNCKKCRKLREGAFKDLKDWLNARDKAYESYLKANKRS